MAKPTLSTARSTYTVKSHITHGVRSDIQTYEAGDDIDLTDSEAAELLAIGKIEAPKAPKEPAADSAA